MEPASSIVLGSYSELMALQRGTQIQIELQSTAIASNPWQETDRASLLELEVYVDGEHDYERQVIKRCFDYYILGSKVIVSNFHTCDWLWKIYLILKQSVDRSQNF